MPSEDFEAAIMWIKTYALDSTASGISLRINGLPFTSVRCCTI
jgi:hypothetical protein